jgi:hypothetical protein
MQIRKSVANRIKENPAQGLPLLLDDIKRVLDEPRLPRCIRMPRDNLKKEQMQRPPLICSKGTCDL